MSKKKKFVIFDGNAVVHRAFHALPPLKTKDGRLVNAVFGFTSILLKAMKELKPDYIAVTFDLKGKTFRHEKFAEYKATRVKQADELYEQFPIVKDVVRAFNINIYEKQGFEADDLIGTLCDKKQVNRDDVTSVIVTGDMDTLQLVDDNTEVFTLRKGMTDTVIYDEKAVKEKFDGLGPDQMIDYKALRGDPSDNIPGVKGIGEKTAIELLKQFGSLEKLYKEIKQESKKTINQIKERVRNLLIEHEKDAFMSQDLARIRRDVKVKFNLEDNKVKDYDKKKILELFSELQFNSLLSRLPEQEGGQKDLFGKVDIVSEVEYTGDRGEYKLIDNEIAFAKFLGELKQQKVFCFDTETDSLDAMNAKLLGISFCWKEGEAYYVSYGFTKITDTTDDNNWLKKLKPIFEDEKVKKVAHNMKFDAKQLKLNGIEMKGFYFDTMIASYLLNSGSRQHGLDALALEELRHEMIPIKALIGEGKKAISLAEVDVAKVAEYSGEDADFTWRLYKKFEPRLKKENLYKLFETIEMPLVQVLLEMEVNGIKLDVDHLMKVGKKVDARIIILEKEIQELAGMEFNVSSPKQLAEILFEKLEIPTHGLKKTKTGISTAAPELEKLRGQHKIIDLISEYRELTKLKSTYIDALPKMIDKKTGRIHTNFNQAITATGRLSSSDPNLQNIPIRTELGREMRKAFVSDRGNKLIAADYSQIELRVVACLAKDQNMMEVFKQGKDIHSATAAKIFDVEEKDVTKDMRRKAKEVNFGVLYGLGSRGLAQRTGITTAEAQEFIQKYFDNYKKVKEYTEEMVEMARKTQLAETMFGRVRHLPDINASMPMLRAAAERIAVNMPIQGTAADLMKIAMIEVYKELKKISPESKMLLQVHDELVIETPNKEVKKVAKVIDEKMEKIHKLAVPIKVDIEVGGNWDEMERVVE
ncbi:DNA polymerase I [Candidatus Falkowbacteria bacterium RIFOXYC2_FULL_36_12]|uniref:DNA polymerase I n=1 Tax=Candidatus Falkowbacteria bacterium RIFOXYC2_FULL_36_12 TaxID=1798002 RepID=A0A1F5T477_9BACT|nr:MAG: DNA polymerase I [Candidatus Falkowbacteria bacterium RIFOXYC2_FULL_36_12]